MIPEDEKNKMFEYYSQRNAIWPNGSIMDYTTLAHQYSRTCPKEILEIAHKYFQSDPCEKKIQLLIQLIEYIQECNNKEKKKIYV